jgi:hypothetical protein
MRHVFIQQKLEELELPLSDIALGDFDFIGEFTAKKNRSQNDALYKSAGAFFRPNYERGILIYSLIRKYKLTSFLEIGFGRGYSALCAAKAMHDNGLPGAVYSVDIKFDQKQFDIIKGTMPNEWLSRIVCVQGDSKQVLPEVFEKQPQFDFVYIDGDHRADAVKADWELVKDRWSNFCLFDDYHLPTKKEADIECAMVIDSIEHPTKELIIMDRRIFFDDRRISDKDINYGQVLLTNEPKSTLNEW